VTKRVGVQAGVDAPTVPAGDVAVVAVDVLRATTTAMTAVASGRRCFPAGSLEDVAPLAARLPDALLAGEQHGELPEGFHLNNSPAALAARNDVERPLILLTTSGTRLIRAAGRHGPVQVACLRNLTAQARALLDREEVVLVGATTKDEFREEDRICCARIAAMLVDAGYEPDDAAREVIDAWASGPIDAFTGNASVDYLRHTGQLADLEFVLGHVDDLNTTYVLRGEEIVEGSRVP
jgi:2-phosphosulfolactate phosphatase